MKKIITILSGVFLLLLSSCNSSDVNKEEQVKTDSLAGTDKMPDKSKSSNILLGELYIEIPDELEEIGEEKAKLKYPGANRPDYVFGTPDMGVNLCYSVTKTPLKLSQLQEYLDKTTPVFDQKFGQENVSQSQMDTINGIPFAILEFYSPTPNEGRVYNLMFTTSYTDKMTVITFNCLESKMADWEEDVSEIFSSITLKK